MKPELKAYLAAERKAKYLLADVIQELQQFFHMTPEEIGRALAQDLREQV
jgi:hypothetical protein